MVGIFAIACSIALIALGKMIDKFPQTGDNERERSLSSPRESTMIAVILFWVLFIPGGWAVLQEAKIVMIVGITTIFAICLFMFTGLVFSFAVLSTNETAGKSIKESEHLFWWFTCKPRHRIFFAAEHNFKTI